MGTLILDPMTPPLRLSPALRSKLGTAALNFCFLACIYLTVFLLQAHRELKRVENRYTTVVKQQDVLVRAQCSRYRGDRAGCQALLSRLLLNATPAQRDSLRGATGPKGSPGARGLQGARGLTGARGIAGARGATGATGPRGLTGNPGPAGAHGNPGANGATGLPGGKGNPGIPGAAGNPGLPGAPGLPGNGNNGNGNAPAP